MLNWWSFDARTRIPSVSFFFFCRHRPGRECGSRRHLFRPCTSSSSPFNSSHLFLSCKSSFNCMSFALYFDRCCGLHLFFFTRPGKSVGVHRWCYVSGRGHTSETNRRSRFIYPNSINTKYSKSIICSALYSKDHGDSY